MGIEPGTFNPRCSGLNQYATLVRDCTSSREYVLLKTQRLDTKHQQKLLSLNMLFFTA